jgi:hypothetical protein
MILFIHGPRHSGKTLLINEFLKSCNDPRVEYYKFYFANHIKNLGLQSLDSDKALHYFSLGNIMTILEMNQRKEYKDKIWLFDRALISAYTWAILRGRLSEEESQNEFKNLIGSELFSNCKTLVIGATGQTGDSSRIKDIWDGFHSTAQEQSMMAGLIKTSVKDLSDPMRKNECRFMFNQFDDQSVKEFNRSCYELLDIEPNK